jgi:hypothetical protein
MQSTNLPSYFTNDNFEVIQVDGKVWINNRTGLIGRYHPITGMDIHTDNTCDDCRAGVVDFDAFVTGIMAKHQIDLTKLNNNRK